MSMKTGLLVTFLTIHLTAAVSTDCGRDRQLCTAAARSDCSITEPSCPSLLRCQHSYGQCIECNRDLKRCLEVAWVSCRILAMPCLIPSQDCRHSHDLCRADGFEVARSMAKASLRAYEVERTASRFGTSAECDSQLKTCLEDNRNSCGHFMKLCLLTVRRCYLSRDICEAAEMGRAQSKVETSWSASEVDRNAINPGIASGCHSQLGACLEETWSSCGHLMKPCLLNIWHCYHSRDLCESAEIETTKSQVEAISSASEVNRNANSSEKPADAEITQSEVESSSSAFEVELSANSSESTAGCSSRLRTCLDNTLKCCGHCATTCLQTMWQCYHSYDHCESAEINGTQSQVESSSSAFEVERSTNSAEILAEPIKSEVESSWSAFELKRDANILRNPNACDSQLMKCIEMNRSGCGRMMRNCPDLVERCVHLRDQCEAGKSGNV